MLSTGRLGDRQDVAQGGSRGLGGQIRGVSPGRGDLTLAITRYVPRLVVGAGYLPPLAGAGALGHSLSALGASVPEPTDTLRNTRQMRK